MGKNISKCNAENKVDGELPIGDSQNVTDLSNNDSVESKNVNYNTAEPIVIACKAMLLAGHTWDDIQQQLNISRPLISKINKDDSIVVAGQTGNLVESLRQQLTIMSAEATKRMIDHAKACDISELPADKAAKAAKDLHTIYRLETNQSTNNVSSLNQIMKSADSRGKRVVDNSVDAVFYDGHEPPIDPPPNEE